MNRFFAKGELATFVDKNDAEAIAFLESIGYTRVTRKEAAKIESNRGSFLGEYAMVSRQRFYKRNASGAFYYRRNPSDGLWYLVRRRGCELE